MSHHSRRTRAVFVYSEVEETCGHYEESEREKRELQRLAQAERERAERYRRQLEAQQQQQLLLEDELIHRMNGCRVCEPESESESESESDDEALAVCAGAPILYHGEVAYDRDNELIVEPCERLVANGYRCKSCYRKYANAISCLRCRGYYIVTEIETRRGDTLKVRSDYACVSPGSRSIDDDDYPGRCRHCIPRIRD